MIVFQKKAIEPNRRQGIDSKCRQIRAQNTAQPKVRSLKSKTNVGYGENEGRWDEERR